MTIVLILAIGPVLAHGETYWIEWTGDAYPETEGWTRTSSDPPAERWLEDGSLFIDSRADWFISDIYSQFDPDFALETGETFVMQWRVKVHESFVGADPGVMIRTEDQCAVKFDLATDTIYSFYEPAYSAAFSAGEFHEFTFETSDFASYTLSIDGAYAWEGAFFDSSFPGAGVGWGDMATHRSLSQWDWFAYGIVPEPPALAQALALVSVSCLSRSLSRRASPFAEGRAT